MACASLDSRSLAAMPTFCVPCPGKSTATSRSASGVSVHALVGLGLGLGLGFGSGLGLGLGCLRAAAQLDHLAAQPLLVRQHARALGAEGGELGLLRGAAVRCGGEHKAAQLHLGQG